MSSVLAPLSELDAVNDLLEVIGQAPVATLANSGIRDANLARNFVTKATRAVQLAGFAFNSDTDYPLAPDATSGTIQVPDGVLRIAPSDRSQRLVARTHPDGYVALWDLSNLTWSMAAPVNCDIVWGYPFENLPEAARAYIAISAGRKFLMRSIGATQMDGYAEADETRAWLLLQRDERRVRQTNMFRDNRELRRQVYDRDGLYLSGYGGGTYGGEVTG